MIPEGLEAAIDSVVPSGVTHIGFVATNIRGEFLVTEPKGHPYDVSATFSKVKHIAGEPPSRTLGRCLREQIGQRPAAVYPVPTVWVGPNSVSYYFGGLLGDIPDFDCLLSSEIYGLCWCSRDAARARIENSKNVGSRQRDLALLSTVATMCLSPYRRVLLMVRELHVMGFERLRAPAYDYPLAWRCPVVPSAWTWRQHGGRFDNVAGDLGRFFGEKPQNHTYSSASRQQPFGWEDVEFFNPRQLAMRFLMEQPEIAFAGWGPDAEYVDWFRQTLEKTAPNGLYYAFAEFEDATTYLYTHCTDVDRIDLPPAGCVIANQFNNFAYQLEQQLPS